MTSTDVRYLHEVLETRATQTPTAIAVRDGTDSLTYAQVWDRSAALAAALADAGARPEVPVGVCLLRSTSLFVTFFAVLRSGAPYLPLDPNNPPRRLGEMVSSSGAQIVVSEPAHDDRLPSGLTVLQPSTAGVGGAPAGPVSPDNAAYVLYTSGSTGGPKGVVVTHRNAIHLMAAQRQAALVPDGSSVVGFASIGFDASIWEMLLAVGAASPLHFASGGIDDLPSGFDYIATLVPSVLEQLDPEQVRYRSVISAGERLPAKLAERWARGRTLRNAYGPTEVTVCATATDPLTKVDTDPAIGYQFGDATLAVLDPAPGAEGGDVGELAVGGGGVARGYVGSPGLTAARFVPDPDGPPGSRRYRTGDLVRRAADGGLKFVGRSDSQIKLNGMRLELGEVERVLLSLDGIGSARVLFESVAGSPRRLVAVAVRDGHAPDEAGIAEHLARRLPAQMVPSSVVVVDELPLTVNGKFDVAAVFASPVPTGEPGPGLGHPARKLVAAVWCDVLEVDRVNADDHFFSLGGHSLLATRLIARLRAVLRRPFPARILFQNPVLADFADAVRDLPTTDTDATGDTFWADLSQNVPSPFGVPAVHPGAPPGTPSASAEVTLERVTAEDVDALARTAIATASMFYVAAFTRALQTAGNTDEIVLTLEEDDHLIPMRITEPIGDLVDDGIPLIRDEVVAAFFTDRALSDPASVQCVVKVGKDASAPPSRALELAVSHVSGPVVLRITAASGSGLDGNQLDVLARHLTEALNRSTRAPKPHQIEARPE